MKNILKIKLIYILFISCTHQSENRITPVYKTQKTKPVSQITNYSDLVQKIIESSVDSTGKDTSKTPSLVVGLVTPTSSEVFGFGSIEINKDLKPHGDTLYAVGSVTKIFTGLLLAKYEVDGKLKTDEKVVQSLPSLLKSFDQRITYKHLVTHYSGLKKMPDNARPKYFATDLADCLNRQGCKPESEPGSEYNYSNYGVGLLGFALKHRFSYEKFDDLLQEQLLTPFKMKNTVLSTNSKIPMQPEFNGSQIAFGYTVNNDLRPMNRIPFLAGAGGLITTGNDLVQFLEFATGKQESRFTEVFRRAVTPLSKGDRIPKTEINKKIGYAIDLFNMKDYSKLCKEKFEDMIVYAKPGNTTTHTAYIVWNPEKKIGVTMLSNRAEFYSVICLSLKVLNQLI